MYNFESPKKQDSSYNTTGNIKTLKPESSPLRMLTDYSEGIHPNASLPGLAAKALSARLPPEANDSINTGDYIQKTIDKMRKGRKYDNGKPRYSLLPPRALEEIVKVLTYGSEKYEDFNWMNLENPNDRFFSAAQRHIWARQLGEKIDPESKTNHLANAITNLMFMLELELLQDK